MTFGTAGLLSWEKFYTFLVIGNAVNTLSYMSPFTCNLTRYCRTISRLHLTRQLSTHHRPSFPPKSPLRQRRPGALASAVSTDQGPSWVTIIPNHLSDPPRILSRTLRLRGRYRDAQAVLYNAGVPRTHSGHDLIEYLLVLLNTDQFASPSHRIRAMADALWNAPARKPKTAFSILLTACARAASQTSDNTFVKTRDVLTTAHTVWRELLAFESGPDPRSISLMYQIAGDCRRLSLAHRIRRDIGDPVLTPSPLASPSSEHALAAYILCLGKCGRSHEAEDLFFTSTHRALRSSDRVLAALFHAHVASGRITKAEALVAMHGSTFLTLNACNAFIRQCITLRLFDTAFDFLSRMERAASTKFPSPSAQTYNLLLRALSEGDDSTEDDALPRRASAVVDRMHANGIAATTVTHNLLLRSFVMRGRMQDALDLFENTPAPDRITFTHMMQGAEKTLDLELAERLLSQVSSSPHGPSYNFCKSYLLVIASTCGIADAFKKARELIHEFGDVLVFADVGRTEAVRMALIHACGKVGDLPSAFQALEADLDDHLDDERGELAPLYVATVLMQACLDCGKHGQAVEVFQSVKNVGLEPNFEVYESLIYGLCLHIRDQTTRPGNWLLHRGTTAGKNAETCGRPVSEEEELEAEWNQNEDFMLQTEANMAEARQIFKVVLHLLREMHDRGAARPQRRASYMYNKLLAAAASVGNFDLAMEIFRRMTRHSNARLLYVSSVGDNDIDATLNKTNSWSELDGCDELPPATVNSYNSMMSAAWRCGKAKDALLIFERMQTDRETEPNGATMSLLADIGLQSGVAVDVLQAILKALDRTHIPKHVAKKRILLRQKMLAMRWAG